MLNENRPSKRKQFTLAHEIVHIIIPLDVGTIVDEIDVELTNDSLYCQLED